MQCHTTVGDIRSDGAWNIVPRGVLVKGSLRTFNDSLRGQALDRLNDLLRETDASPALRSALYRAAAGLSGVKSIGTVTDELGRKGVGLAIDSHGSRHEMIFSAATSALLSEQVVLIGHAPGVRAKRGTVLSWSAYTAGRVVDRLPVASPLPLTPPCRHGGETGLSVPGHPQDGVMVGSSAAVGR